MGCACCCFNVRDDPEDGLDSSSSDRSCICLNSLIHTIFNKYESLFRENQYQISTLPSTNQAGQGAVSSTSNVPPDTITSSPRSVRLNLDSESRIRDGIVAKAENGGAALRIDKDLEHFSNGGYISLEHVKGALMKKCRLDPSLKSSEDEDVCPTCLEEYTSDNPRTVMQCSHHYHLSCIYEWMERSATCPVCGKVMLFDETT